LDRGSTDGRLADDVGFSTSKVGRPAIFARVEKPYDALRYRINRREVRPFAEIVVRASPSQIRRIVAAAVLAGPDVFDVKSEEGVVVLITSAILATIAGPPANQVSGCLIH
jgi:hypothetical protein